MNDIGHTPLPMPFEGRPTLKMSSPEIAELTTKRHDNVVRDIKALVVGLYGAEHDTFETLTNDPSKLRHLEKSITWENDSRGYISSFHLDKEHTITLIAGYDVKLRKRIIDRWMELEAAISIPALPDLSDPLVLTHLLMEHATKRIEAEKRAVVAEAKVEAAEPKTAFFDKFVNADGLHSLQNGGRVLSQGPNRFIGMLKQGYVFYQGGNLVPKVQYRESGLFEVKVTMVDDKARPQTFITPKGIQYFAKKLGVTPNLGAAE